MLEEDKLPLLKVNWISEDCKSIQAEDSTSALEVDDDDGGNDDDEGDDDEDVDVDGGVGNWIYEDCKN